MRTRDMGVVTGREGVLKLVYPGRFVEIYKRIITAAEVMRKNPRHCVTRPDVFEYPWIVVRPESVLHLGRVFFIIPNHTLNKLLKSRGYHRHNHKQCPQESQSSIEYAWHQEVLEIASPIKSFAGVTPKYHKSREFQNQVFHTLTWDRENSEEYVYGERSQLLRPLFQAISLDKVSPHPREHVYGGKRFQSNNKPFQTSSSDRECSQKQFWGERFHRQSQSQSLAEVTTRHQHAYQKFNKKSQTDSMIAIRTPHYEDCNSSRAASTRVEEDNVLVNKSREATSLKSCLRKHDSVRKLLHLRVSFLLPVQDED